MNTLRKDTRVLRCDERGCGVPFMLVKRALDGQDVKIGLAEPRPVARNPANGEELMDKCPRHPQ